MSIFLSKNASETKKMGEVLSEEILKTGLLRKALILGLIGDLGGGKTTFLQGFAKGLKIKERVLSPTFIIMRRFDIKQRRFKNFYHFDCYRIQKPKDILELGFKRMIENPENIIAIEWADRVFKILPKNTLVLEFDFVDDKTRKVSLRKI